MKLVNGVTLAELGKKLNLEVAGDGARLITAVVTPEDGRPDALCVVWEPRNLKLIGPDVPILGKPEFFCGSAEAEGRVGLAAKDPKGVLPNLLKLFAPNYPEPEGVHPSAVVSPDAEVAEGVYIGPLCIVEQGAVIERGVRLEGGVYVGYGVRIGEGTTVKPNVSLLAGTCVGKNCLFHSGCVLGSDGFGFVPGPAGIVKVPQIGGVIVGDDVEIGACTTIDRGTMKDTVIGSGTKLDNLVQVAHNVQIGKHCIVCALTGMSGSSALEDGVTVSGQVGVVEHLRVGKGAVLAARTLVTRDVPDGAVVSGFPARPHSEAKKAQVLSARLPELYERIKKLERLLEEREIKCATAD